MSSFLPLKANDDVRAATCKPETLDSAVIKSSVMPSLKYSFSLSELMLTKGNTAMDFVAGVHGVGAASKMLGCGHGRLLIAPHHYASRDKKIATSAAMPARRHFAELRLPQGARRPLRPRQHHAVDVDRHLNVLQLGCGRRTSGSSILLRIWSNTGPVMQIPPASASGSMRAAMLTPSPKTSPSRTSTSPRWRPMRTWMRRSAAAAALLLDQRRLDRDGAARCLQRAAELHEEPVAGSFDLVSAVLEKDGPQPALMLGQQIERQRFVALRQRAVADHVGEHDRRELALGAFRRHVTSFRTPPIALSATSLMVRMALP